jgi:hypothetical protein
MWHEGSIPWTQLQLSACTECEQIQAKGSDFVQWFLFGNQDYGEKHRRNPSLWRSRFWWDSLMFFGWGTRYGNKKKHLLNTRRNDDVTSILRVGSSPRQYTSNNHARSTQLEVSLRTFITSCWHVTPWVVYYLGHPEFPVNPNISEKLRSESCQEEDKSRMHMHTPHEKSSYKMYVSVPTARTRPKENAFWRY